MNTNQSTVTSSDRSPGPDPQSQTQDRSGSQEQECHMPQCPDAPKEGTVGSEQDGGTNTAELPRFQVTGEETKAESCCSDPGRICPVSGHTALETLRVSVLGAQLGQGWGPEPSTKEQRLGSSKRPLTHPSRMEPPHRPWSTGLGDPLLKNCCPENHTCVHHTHMYTLVCTHTQHGAEGSQETPLPLQPCAQGGPVTLS